MKPKRIKSPNRHLFAVRLPKELVDKVNKARVDQGLEWAELVSDLFQTFLIKHPKKKLYDLDWSKE